LRLESYKVEATTSLTQGAHALQNRLRVPPFTSVILGADPMFYPPLRHRSFIGTGLYDYYGIICRPPCAA